MGSWGWGGEVGGRDRPYGSAWADLSHVAYEAAGKRHSYSQRDAGKNMTRLTPRRRVFSFFFFSSSHFSSFLTV